jgi:hypothetical protein
MCPGTFSGYQEIQACVSPASPVSQQALKRNNILLIISINEKITIYTDSSASGSCTIAYNQA